MTTLPLKPLAFELNRVSKRYGPVVALDEVCLSAEVGERLVLVGPSGAGKSTILNAIAGLTNVDAGDVVIAGRAAHALPPHLRNLSLLTQEYSLYPHLDVRQNLAAALHQSPGTKADKSQAVETAIQAFDLATFATRLPSELSGGQAQRVAFAKALIRNPHILLLDEPFSQMDLQLKWSAKSLLRQHLSKDQRTVVLTTHDPLDALQFGDRIAIVHQGRVVQCGTPDEVYNHPTSVIAATLFSPFGLNWIDMGTLRRYSKSSIPVELSELGDNVRLGIRPESIQVENGSSSDAASSPNVMPDRTEPCIRLPIVVESLQMTGPIRQAFASCGEMHWTILHANHVRTTGVYQAIIAVKDLMRFDQDSVGS